jgi:uncharacterized membrane protein YphA (DoxX/SURF4 family)
MFVWAAALKIINPLEFAQTIKNYRLFPREMAFFMALTIPWIEAVSGTLLALGIFRRASSFIIAVFLFFFIILVSVTMLRGIDTTCGCFGSLSGRADWKLLFTDGALFVLALTVFFSRSDKLVLAKKLS